MGSGFGFGLVEVRAGGGLDSMRGKVCVVTGATSGIGLVTARELARQGATVGLVGRDPGKTASVLERIRRETGNDRVSSFLADLSSSEQVRALGEQIERNYEHLDVLVNNAGAMFVERRESVDGHEMTFALNHLNYFVLTNRLLDLLKRSAPSRVVNVASDAHLPATLDFEDLQLKKKYHFWTAYSRSKLMNVLFTYELARRLEGTGVTANALHPGVVATNFASNNGVMARVVMSVMRLMMIPPEKGALTSIHLASSREVEEHSGKYFDHKQREKRSSMASQDREAQSRLWAISEQIAG